MVASITHSGSERFLAQLFTTQISRHGQAEKLLHLTAAAMLHPQIAKFTLLTAALASVIGCAADALPRRPPAATGSSSQNAIVYVESPVAQREFTGGETDVYYVSFSLREATGNAGATIKAMDLTFGNGVTATFGPERATAASVGPG